MLNGRTTVNVPPGEACATFCQRHVDTLSCYLLANPKPTVLTSIVSMRDISVELSG